MKTALVCGAGGFIGSHPVKRLKSEGFWIRSVDLKFPEFSETQADDFAIGDLIEQKLRWRPLQPLSKGIEKTYNWVSSQL